MPEDKACTHRFTGDNDNGRSEPGPGSHQPCPPFCGHDHGGDDHGKIIIIVKQKHSNKEVHITKTINQIVIGMCIKCQFKPENGGKKLTLKTNAYVRRS